MKKMLMTGLALAAGVLLAAASCCTARPRPAASPGDIFKTAVAVWHMGDLKDAVGKNGLSIVGNVTVGKKLEGKELRESLACGNDGVFAQIDGGYLDAAQGAGGALNITGSALTVSARMRRPSGVWGAALFSKHGGHDRLVYNLYSHPSIIGFELGTRGAAGLSRTTVPVAGIGAKEWHTIICRYDGTRLQMFADGVMMDETFPKGPLRKGNIVPCLIGAESVGGKIKSGWKIQVDHVAIWKRALSDAEIGRLSGGAERIAAARKRFSGGLRTFKADKRYLVFPCSRGLRGRNKVFINVDGKPYMSVYDALIASSNPDHWRFIDLKLLQGKTLSVKIEGPDAAGIKLVKTSDTIPGKYPVYREPGRPKIHFSPLRGWLNDPSGMIYFDGKWHLYYANTRFSNVMAGPNNAWGHATSTDLLHWEEQPIFLTPVRGKCSFWTGGAAVDVANTTGLNRPGKPVIVFSANNGSDAPNSFTQCTFASTDGGMTAIRNPEMMYKPLPADKSRRGGGTRDPMIFWYAPEKKWVMVVYVQLSGVKNTFCFFESKDLKNWTETSVLDDMYECPNLFQLPVDGKKADTRWVTWGSSTEYRIGKFNGKAFVPDHKRKLRAHHGQYSASQVFANAPGGRIVQIGWAHCCDYQKEFSQMASFPLELSLRTTPDGVRLYQDFIPELAKLRNKGSKRKDVVVKAGAPLKVGDVSQPAEIIAEFDPGNASRVTFTGAELNVSWTAKSRQLDVNGQRIRLSPKNGRVVLHILLDIPSVEVVSGGGENYIIKGRDYRKLGEKSPMEIRADGGDVKFGRLEVYPLKSIH